MTSTALSPPLLTVASGNTHPSPGRAAGNMAITFSPVELYFPGQPHTQMLILLMKAFPYGKNIKNVPGGVHLGRRPSLLCGDVSRHLELMRRYCSLPELTVLVQLCRDHLMFCKMLNNCLQSHVKYVFNLPLTLFQQRMWPAYHGGSDFFVK